MISISNVLVFDNPSFLISTDLFMKAYTKQINLKLIFPNFNFINYTRIKFAPTENKFNLYYIHTRNCGLSFKVNVLMNKKFKVILYPLTY